MCAPLCRNNLCCASLFCTGGQGAGGSGSKNLSDLAIKQILVTAGSKNLSDLAMKQILVQGHTPRLSDKVRELGISSTHNQKTQDSQHKLNQPRGFFLEMPGFQRSMFAIPVNIVRSRRLFDAKKSKLDM